LSLNKAALKLLRQATGLDEDGPGRSGSGRHSMNSSAAGCQRKWRSSSVR
jgi:hypothetical protein